jgi:hypothetical protein
MAELASGNWNRNGLHTPLVEAVPWGLPMVQALLDAGASVNVPGARSGTRSTTAVCHFLRGPLNRRSVVSIFLQEFTGCTCVQLRLTVIQQ